MSRLHCVLFSLEVTAECFVIKIKSAQSKIMAKQRHNETRVVKLPFNSHVTDFRYIQIIPLWFYFFSGIISLIYTDRAEHTCTFTAIAC